MIRRYSLIMGMILSLILISPAPVSARSEVASVRTIAACGLSANNLFGIQPWYACLPGADTGEPRLEKLTDVYKIAFPVLDSLVKIGVFVAAGYIFFMLFKMAMARGDSGKIGTAISGIRDATIGLIIAMVSVAIVNFIAGAFS